jgi:CRP-like cAMP-binding protein
MRRLPTPGKSVADFLLKPMHSHQHGINIEALLAHVPLFNGFDARGNRPHRPWNPRSACRTWRHPVPQGRHASSGFHLIVYGQVKLAFTSPAGGEKVVEILDQGQTFGEAVMFMDKPYLVYAQALSRLAAAAHIQGSDHGRTGKRPQARPQDDRRHGHAPAPPDHRRRILFPALWPPAHHRLPAAEQIDSDDAEKSITVTLSTNKGVIASRLNLTQEHFSRILHELSDKGLITVEGRKIHIPDVRSYVLTINEPCGTYTNQEETPRMALETEIKLSLPANAARRVPAHRLLADSKPIRQKLINTYYDTPDQALQRKRLAVRYRQKGDVWLLTVKSDAPSPGGLAQRSEWEAPGQPGEFDFSHVDNPKLRRFLEAATPDLVPVFTTDFTRSFWLLTPQEGTRIELALDRGKIVAGERQETICEVELELLEGEVADLFSCGNRPAGRSAVASRRRQQG